LLPTGRYLLLRGRAAEWVSQGPRTEPALSEVEGSVRATRSFRLGIEMVIGGTELLFSCPLGSGVEEVVDGKGV